MLHQFIHSSRRKLYQMIVLIETRGHHNTEISASIAKIIFDIRLKQTDYLSDIINESNRKKQQDFSDNDTFFFLA